MNSIPEVTCSIAVLAKLVIQYGTTLAGDLIVAHSLVMEVLVTVLI